MNRNAGASMKNELRKHGKTFVGVRRKSHKMTVKSKENLAV